jgi:hypothetical protein
VRFVGPHQEARDRLRGRSPGTLAKRSNVFWIGQPTMPFSK